MGSDTERESCKECKIAADLRKEASMEDPEMSYKVQEGIEPVSATETELKPRVCAKHVRFFEESREDAEVFAQKSHDSRQSSRQMSRETRRSISPLLDRTPSAHFSAQDTQTYGLRESNALSRISRKTRQFLQNLVNPIKARRGEHLLRGDSLTYDSMGSTDETKRREKASHDELSKENLLAFNKYSESSDSGFNHSIACALVNILGGLILGYSDVGVNTALSVLYPCALQCVPEHDYMWKISGLLSIVNIGAAAGSLIGGYAAEKYGRKYSMAAGGVISLAPLMTMVVRSYYLQFFSRIITGCGVGILSSICGTYVSEMAPAKSRGFLNCFFEVSINTGILLASIAAYYLLGRNRDLEIDDYCLAIAGSPSEQSSASFQLIWYMMLGSVIIAVLFLLLVLSPLVPESKVWLSKHTKVVGGSHPDRDSVYSRSTLHTNPEAPIHGLPTHRTHRNFDQQSLTTISVGWAAALSSSGDSLEERDAALHDFHIEPDHSHTPLGVLQPISSSAPTPSIEEPIKPYDPERHEKLTVWKKLSLYRKPITIAVFDAIALQLTGMYALMFYAHKFLEIGHIKKKMLGTTLIMTWNWVSTFISLALVERAGRRRLLIPSMFVLTMTIISMPLAIIYGKGATHGVFFLFLLLGIYICSYEIGPGVLFWVILAEVFPHEIASWGFAVVNSLQWILMVIVTFLFPPLQKMLGGWVFAVFFLPSLLSTIFFYFVLPETKGRSRREVAREMRNPKWIAERKRFW